MYNLKRQVKITTFKVINMLYIICLTFKKTKQCKGVKKYKSMSILSHFKSNLCILTSVLSICKRTRKLITLNHVFYWMDDVLKWNFKEIRWSNNNAQQGTDLLRVQCQRTHARLQRGCECHTELSRSAPKLNRPLPGPCPTLPPSSVLIGTFVFVLPC